MANADSGKILYADVLAENLLGMPRNEIIGRCQWQLHPPVHCEFQKQESSETVVTGGRTDKNIQVIRADGTIVRVDIGGRVMTIAGRRWLYA